MTRDILTASQIVIRPAAADDGNVDFDRMRVYLCDATEDSIGTIYSGEGWVYGAPYAVSAHYRDYASLNVHGSFSDAVYALLGLHNS